MPPVICSMFFACYKLLNLAVHSRMPISCHWCYAGVAVLISRDYTALLCHSSPCRTTGECISPIYQLRFENLSSPTRGWRRGFEGSMCVSELDVDRSSFTKAWFVTYHDGRVLKSEAPPQPSRIRAMRTFHVLENRYVEPNRKSGRRI